MKKTIVLGSILAASMLSGCFFATETITCTKTEEESGMNSTQKIEAVFKSKKVQSQLKLLINHMFLNHERSIKSQFSIIYRLVIFVISQCFTTIKKMMVMIFLSILHLLRFLIMIKRWILCE